MIFDGEEHETLRVFSQQWLICLKLFDSWSSLWNLWCDDLNFLLLEYYQRVDGEILDWSRQVLFVLDAKVKLLCRRVFDLEVFEARSRLDIRVVSVHVCDNIEVHSRGVATRTCFEGVI